MSFEKIKNSNFVKYGLCQNYWLWFHIFSAAIGTKLFLLFLSPFFVFVVVGLIAIVWEIVEFKYEIYNKQGKNVEWKKTPYRSKTRWLIDGLGDILGALFISGIILIQEEILVELERAPEWLGYVSLLVIPFLIFVYWNIKKRKRK